MQQVLLLPPFMSLSLQMNGRAGTRASLHGNRAAAASAASSHAHKHFAFFSSYPFYSVRERAHNEET
jgi:hypothetical protein